LDSIPVPHRGDYSNNDPRKVEGLMAAAGEMWLFSLCDFHIISRYRRMHRRDDGQADRLG
jgi:hypothetical protein